MSRICGFYKGHGEVSQASTLINDLMKPMFHSPSWESESTVDVRCSLARIFYESDVTVTYLQENGHKGATCLFNGYLLNQDSLSKAVLEETRGEVKADNPAAIIAYLILSKGAKALTGLNGIFSFVLWLPSENTFWLGVDRYGMRPLYYMQQAGLVKFATEDKALLATESDAKPDYSALEEMFVLGALLGDKTMYENISRVPAATVLKFDHGSMESFRYWWWDEMQIDTRQTVEEFIVENDRLFRNTITGMAAKHDDVSCFLSSGHDSRRIILELANCGKRVHAFTTAFSKTRDRYEVESGIARQICAELGVNHTVVEHCEPREEPRNLFNMFTLLNGESDEHHFIMNLLPQVPANGPVNFDGINGDVLMYGEFLDENIIKIIHDNKKVARLIANKSPNYWQAHVKWKSKHPPLEDRILNIVNDLPDSENKLTLYWMVTRVRREIILFPYGLVNLKMESYLPYFDNTIVNQALSLPPLLKQNARIQERTLRYRYNDLMERIPNSHIENLSTKPEDRHREFVRPIGDYWTRVRREVNQASCKEMLKSGKFFFGLKLKAQVVCLGFLVLNLFNCAPKFVLEKSWSLMHLGLLAFHHNNLRNRDRMMQKLEKARHFVFSSDDKK